MGIFHKARSNVGIVAAKTIGNNIIISNNIIIYFELVTRGNIFCYINYIFYYTPRFLQNTFTISKRLTNLL